MTSSTNSPKRGFIGGLLGFHVRLAQLRLFSDFTAAIGDPALTPLLTGALYLIAENPGANQRDLAALLATDPSTMVRLIDQLEARSLLRRVTHAADRRTSVPTLTPAGRALLEAATPLVRASEAAFAAPLTGAERAQLLQLLRRLNGAPLPQPGALSSG